MTIHAGIQSGVYAVIALMFWTGSMSEPVALAQEQVEEIATFDSSFNPDGSRLNDSEITAEVPLPGASVSPWSSMFNRPALPYTAQDLSSSPHGSAGSDYWYHWAALGRGYYVNDQRIEFTGLEATFGVQAVLRGEAGHQIGQWQGIVYGEFFLNQPFDRNLLTDYPLRDSFAHNFEIDTFEISQLSIVAQRGDLQLEIGRFVTPFGRYYGFSYLNSFVDSPFVRSEAILFRETGVLARWEPSVWRMAAGLTNGGLGQDTNSSKAFVGRAGLEFSNWSFGTSVKWQDGIGSESQKEFKNHVGADLMIRLSDRMLASTEFIYDEYGLRRPGIALDDIDWGRSIYNRQINKGLNQQLTGWGYYLNLISTGQRWDWSISFGQFHPRPVGDPIHDQITSRLIANTSYKFSPALDCFGLLILENSVDNAQAGRIRNGIVYSFGMQFRF